MGSLISRLASAVVTGTYYALTPFWLSLWPPIQILYIQCKRSLVRERNLNFPLTLPPIDQQNEAGTPANVRTFEGSGNNRDKQTMGMSGCPFARNTPRRAAEPSVGPDPAVVSEQLLARPGGVTKTRPLVNLLGGRLEMQLCSTFSNNCMTTIAAQPAHHTCGASLADVA
jgi:hypothetical protein